VTLKSDSFNAPWGMAIGLWGLTFGDGVANARAGLYFAAGPDDEMHGMFGVITAAAPRPRSEIAPGRAAGRCVRAALDGHHVA
jgi:hypothetical protein